MIRLLIADDHAMVREGLRRLLSEHGDLRVTAEAATGDEVLTAVCRDEVDVVLLDVSMPGPRFLEVLSGIRATAPRTKVLVLSAQPEDQYAVRALKAGAAGYLSKDRTGQELAVAIRRVHQGGRYVSPTLAEKLAFDLGPDAQVAPHEALSEREHHVLALIGAGQSIKEIAARLDVSPKTVSTYRTRVLEKLGLKTTADLIRYAVEHRLTP